MKASRFVSQSARRSTMFHQLFQHPPTIERHQAAPLLEERRSYLAHCADQGRTKSSLRLIAQHLLVFVDYLPLTTVREIDIEHLHAAADRWVNRRPLPPNVTDYYYGRMRFISDARQWLHFLGGCASPKCLSTHTRP